MQADDPDLEGTPQYNEAGGDVFQYTDGSAPAQPPTRAQEEAHNVNLRTPGYPNGFRFDPDESPTVPDSPDAATIPKSGGLDALNLYQKFLQMGDAHDLATARETKLAAAPASQADSNGPIATPTGRHTVKTPYGYVTPESAIRYYGGANQGRTGAPRSTAPTMGTGRVVDPDKADDQWMRTNSEVPLARWGRWTNGMFVGNDGKGSASGQTFTAEAPGDPKGEPSIRMPRAIFEEGQRRYQQYGQRHSGTQPGQPSTAQQMYQQQLSSGGAGAGAGGGARYAGASPDDVLAEARSAIQGGADPATVKARLEAMKIDSSGL